MSRLDTAVGPFSRWIALLLVTLFAPATCVAAEDAPSWVEPMKRAHSKFTGRPGTFAMFGDSITVSMAFWAPLAQGPKNLSPQGQDALNRVAGFMRPECWREWRGPAFGSEGGKTTAWAAEHVDTWLKELNPEVVLLMFGTNDLSAGVTVEDFAATTKRVAQRCLDNGSIVILTTIPPRRGHVKHSKVFAEAARNIAAELTLPLVDYHAEISKRRPDDWDGSRPPFAEVAGNDVYNVATLISADGVHPSAPQDYAGDFSAEALERHGYNLRSNLTLISYADVIGRILKPSETDKPGSKRR